AMAGPPLSRSGDEVHQTLDRPEQGGLDIAVGADGGEHAPEAVGGLAPAEPVADAGLPVLAPRDHRPFADADGGRLDRLPDVDIRVPRDQDVTTQSRDDRRFLAALHQ